MPLTPLQRKIAGVLKPYRSQSSFVAGGAALNSKWPRLSDDMDIFQDQRSHLTKRVQPELAALRDAGISVEVTTEDDWMVEAILRLYGFETKVQWLDEPETCRRFFPAIEDDELGYRLHQADVAVNKVLCASRRQSAARDAVDLANIVMRYCPLGPLVWAVTSKEDERSPPQLLRDIRKIAFGYSNEEIETVRVEGAPMNRDELRKVLDPALEAAGDYCDEVAPPEHAGHLFVDPGEVPIEADDGMIEVGSAIAMPIREFGTTVVMD